MTDLFDTSDTEHCPECHTPWDEHLDHVTTCRELQYHKKQADYWREQAQHYKALLKKRVTRG